MAEQLAAARRIAQQVKMALEAADLAAFSDLLDPNVRWGPPGDPSPPCQNRDQVLAWYRRGRQAGIRARVSETVVLADRILVGLKLVHADQVDPQFPGLLEDSEGHLRMGDQATTQSGGEADRWQVLTVRAGRVVDIVGFDERSEAAAHAGLDPGPP